MPDKRIWKSAVARILTQQQKNAPISDSVAARLIARMRKGMLANEAAAMLAQKLLALEELGSGDRIGPINLPAVCEKVGLDVQYQPLLADALLQETESGYLAIINSAHKPSRQRLSLAHEIGHLMLYQATGLRQAFGHLSPDERQSGESVEIEELCDAFAAELVMPSDAWRRQVLTEGMSLRTLRDLMNCYGVSIATAARQAVTVGAIECAIIVWTPVHENDSLIELKPVRWWERLTSRGNGQPRSIPNSQEFRISGSPLIALEKRTETTGTLPSLFNNTKGHYIAHSALIEAKYVATLIIPERLGWGMMFRKSQARSLSTPTSQ